MSMHRRGLAMVFAVVLVGLVGPTLAVLASLLVSDAKRTQSAVAEAQLRQLLTAGAACASRQVQTLVANGKEQAVMLPEELSASGGKLVLSASSKDNAADVTVTARLEGREMAHTLGFIRKQSGWELASARLEN